MTFCSSLQKCILHFRGIRRGGFISTAENWKSIGHMSNTLSSVVWICHKKFGRLLLSDCYSGSVLWKKDCKEKWWSLATYTNCFGQTIIPIKLITVSFLSHNVLAKSLPPLNKTQCLWMLGHNLSLIPKWDCIILSNLPSITEFYSIF